MLITAKNKLQEDLYNAFYNAYMSNFVPNVVTEEKSYDLNIKNAMEKKAKTYATGLSKDVANAIYNFVKEISIQASVKGVISPMGPCTGMLIPADFKIM